MTFVYLLATLIIFLATPDSGAGITNMLNSAFSASFDGILYWVVGLAVIMLLDGRNRT